MLKLLEVTVRTNVNLRQQSKRASDRISELVCTTSWMLMFGTLIFISSVLYFADVF